MIVKITNRRRVKSDSRVTKAVVNLEDVAGSMEEKQHALQDALEQRYPDQLVNIVGTFDDRVVFQVTTSDADDSDPGSSAFQAIYSMTGDSVTIGASTPMDVALVPVPSKARRYPRKSRGRSDIRTSDFGVTHYSLDGVVKNGNTVELEAARTHEERLASGDRSYLSLIKMQHDADTAARNERRAARRLRRKGRNFAPGPGRIKTDTLQAARLIDQNLERRLSELPEIEPQRPRSRRIRGRDVFPPQTVSIGAKADQGGFDVHESPDRLDPRHPRPRR
jgi:hypothetical protein